MGMNDDVDERVERANMPAREAMRLHPFYKGKIAIAPKVCVRDLSDFAIWYTPGVAAPCREIAADRSRVYAHTNKGNAVAVVSDGTRVLGLGDIGPEAALPVMEGKALIFKYLGGVDAYPICLDTKDPEKLIETVKLLQPSFGGINLEDISNPKCFYILDRLRREMDIPVWHDDQQGTATVELAGAINALELVGKSLDSARVTVVGAGAASMAITRLLISAGAPRGDVRMVDSKGILSRARRDLEQKQEENPYKWKMCLETNSEGLDGGLVDACRGADLLIAASRPGPDTISQDAIRVMADDAIVFATANPTPEIWPWKAHEAGARIVATGRSDFPNQVNNSLVFPAIFRGALDVGASSITDEMCIAAAGEIAAMAREQGLSETRIIPSMDEWEVFVREAVAVGMKAIELGIARTPMAKEELEDKARKTISSARRHTSLLMESGIIPMPPEDHP